MAEPGRARGVVATLLLLALLGASGMADAAPRIGVLTMGPGSEYWSRFGHNALLVERADRQRTVYNFGFFDFEQPGFLLRFARGQMRYRLVALPFDRDFAYYQAEGRSMHLQWLHLDPEQAVQLADYLAWNARPENAEYRYDYFLDNCSTRVRDALDRALGGLLREQTRGRSRGLSYRSEALRLAAAEPWMYLGIHLLLGPASDRPLSRWEEAFVPERLRDALSVVQLRDARPLVAEHIELLPQRLPDSRESEPRFAVLAAALGLGAALLVLLLAPRRGAGGALGRLLLGGFWLASGLVGATSLLLWTLTEHGMAAANRGLLLTSPLCLPLLLALIPLARGTPIHGWQRRLAGLCALAAAVSLPLYLLPVRPQDHLEWILLALPLHLAAWRLLKQRDDGFPSDGGDQPTP
jgi:hypothetical protein